MPVWRSPEKVRRALREGQCVRGEGQLAETGWAGVSKSPGDGQAARSGERAGLKL